MDQRVKVRMGNRKIMDMKKGSWKQKWDEGEQGLEFQDGVAHSITSESTWLRRLGYRWRRSIRSTRKRLAR